MDTQDRQWVYFSTRQQLVLGYLPFATAPFSAFGSAAVAYYILGRIGRSRRNSFHRIMLGISAMDMISSLGMLIFGIWAVPKEASYFSAGAQGTFRTCAASGFLLNFQFGSMWYTMFLALHFLLVIGFEHRESSKLVKNFEKVGHLVAAAYPLLTGIVGATTQSINPIPVLPGWCYFWSYPVNCRFPDGPDCARGLLHTQILTHLAGSAPIVVSAVNIVCMIILTRKVRTTEMKMQRYQYTGALSNGLRRTKQTGIQSILYIAAFFVVFLPLFLTQILFPYREKPFYFYVAVLGKLLTPLQGALNCFIFMRKRLLGGHINPCAPLAPLERTAPTRQNHVTGDEAEETEEAGSTSDPAVVSKAHIPAWEADISTYGSSFAPGIVDSD